MNCCFRPEQLQHQSPSPATTGQATTKTTNHHTLVRAVKNALHVAMRPGSWHSYSCVHISHPCFHISVLRAGHQVAEPHCVATTFKSVLYFAYASISLFASGSNCHPLLSVQKYIVCGNWHSIALIFIYSHPCTYSSTRGVLT